MKFRRSSCDQNEERKYPISKKSSRSGIHHSVCVLMYSIYLLVSTFHTIKCKYPLSTVLKSREFTLFFRAPREVPRAIIHFLSANISRKSLGTSINMAKQNELHTYNLESRTLRRNFKGNTPRTVSRSSCLNIVVSRYNYETPSMSKNPSF